MNTVLQFVHHAFKKKKCNPGIRGGTYLLTSIINQEIITTEMATDPYKQFLNYAPFPDNCAKFTKDLTISLIKQNESYKVQRSGFKTGL